MACAWGLQSDAERGCCSRSGVMLTADPRKLPLVTVPSASDGKTNSTLRGNSSPVPSWHVREDQEAIGLPEGTLQLRLVG